MYAFIEGIWIYARILWYLHTFCLDCLQWSSSISSVKMAAWTCFGGPAPSTTAPFSESISDRTRSKSLFYSGKRKLNFKLLERVCLSSISSRLHKWLQNHRTFEIHLRFLQHNTTHLSVVLIAQLGTTVQGGANSAGTRSSAAYTPHSVMYYPTQYKNSYQFLMHVKYAHVMTCFHTQCSRHNHSCHHTLCFVSRMNYAPGVITFGTVRLKILEALSF